MSGHTKPGHEGRARSGSEGTETHRAVEQAQAQAHYRQGQGYSQRYHGSKAWWSVGEFLHQGITHQSVGLSLGQNDEETWDLSDSLADLYHAVTHRQQKEANRMKGHNRRGSSGGGGRVDGDKSVDIQRWLADDTSHGFIRVFASDADTNSRLFPCTLSTSAQKICLQLGIPGNALHVQLSGDVIRRMEPFDCPLAIQNEYLAGLGYTDIKYIQEEGPKEDLAYLVRFYAGKPLSDSTYSRNQLSTYAFVRKGKLLHQWVKRLCVISGTRLLIYREKGAEPTVVQLAKGSVEEVQVKGQPFVLKLTSTLQGERSLYLSLISQEDYNKWLKKIRKATAKLPSKADLSNCHLEFLPETVFINTELQILILRHNCLRERPIEEDIYTIGWLDDLPRFSALRSLNLANNQLNSFPLSLCSMRSLLELNLASNKLEEIPPQISELVNLQVLHLHNNLLSSLPDEIAHMRNLAVIVLAFNQFTHIPHILLQAQHAAYKLDSIIMAGNFISRLPIDHLGHMTHIKKIDLRLNQLQLLPSETSKFQNLEHVTHVDIRENQVTDLDIRAIRCMEYLNCERNHMRSMQLNGASLKNLYAAHNCLQTLSINPKPEWLTSMNVSHNKLTELPNWLPDCFFLVHLDISHNQLRALPERLFTDAQKLKIVKANHNSLASLPEKIRSDTLEELHLQHNLIKHLSTEFFIKAHRLRYLNMTRNKLCDLPPPNKNDSYNKLQELYLSFNHLANQALNKICCFPRLRVLHLSRNKISVIEETDIEKLEQLMELNVSSNNLTYLPAALGRHPKLQVLRANCNLLQELPNFKHSSGLKVLEVSSNHLVNVNMSNLMASQVSLLDISANPNILVKSHDIDAAKNSKRLCMVDMRGQNWSLEDVRAQGVIDDGQLWQTGLSQTSGIRNKLSVTAINKPHFSDKGEAMFAIFDGGRNESVAGLLCDIIPNVLREERARCKNPEVYLKHCMLSAHRNLRSQGQKLGASGVVVHLHKDEMGQHVLSVANVGNAQVVLCRQKKAYLLSRPFIVAEDTEDTARVIKTGGIITEDGRVSGVTYNTRLLGCSYLFPHVIPDPHVSSTTLTSDDAFFVVASHGLWQHVTYDEAIKEIKDTPDPVVAAKRLQDLAQGYGSRENVAVLVVRLMLSEEERFRIKDLMKVQRAGQKELLKILSMEGDLLQLRDGVPKVQELNDVIIDKAGHAKKHRSVRKHLVESGSVGSGQSTQVSEETISTNSSPSFLGENLFFQDELSRKRNTSHNKQRKEKSDGDAAHPSESRLYKKKFHGNSHTSWENMMKKRISEEVKVKELKHSFDPEDDVEESGRDEDDDEISEAEMANWIAMKQRKKPAERLEDWETQLQHRVTQELVNRELKKFVQNNGGEEAEETIEEENWSTRPLKKASSEILARNFVVPSESIFKNGQIPDPNLNADSDVLISNGESSDSLPNEVIHMMADSSHSGFPQEVDGIARLSCDPNTNDDSYNRISPNEGLNVSPCESVSSIDVRLHNEADEIYRLRYFNSEGQNEEKTKTHLSGSEVSKSGFSETGQIVPDASLARPMSPDSLISDDEFVKPPVKNANIDRDALLFHQMQMARAQAHAGSSASLDSIQSAPMHASRRDIYPDVRASSHSIEVLVNIGEGKADNSVSDSMRGGRIEWGSNISGHVSGTSTLTSSRVANIDSESDSQSRTHVESMKTFNRQVEAELHSIKKTGSTHGGAFIVEDNDDADEEEDEDRDTLVGDPEDLGLLDDDDVAGLSVHPENIQTEASVSQISVQRMAPSASEMDQDSDSDESIGNVSLEDGYSAMEFSRIGKKGSLSMLNVLESETEEYPELFMSKKSSARFVKANISPKVSQRNLAPGKTKENVGTPSRAKHGKVNDDYEDIDDEEGSKLNVDDSINYADDINPYEDVGFVSKEETKETKSTLRIVPEPNNANLSSEEDIDALYAKVNKIKMDKIRGNHSVGEVTEDNLDELFPVILPGSKHGSNNSLNRYNPKRSFSEMESSVTSKSDNVENRSEKEIFMSASDLLEGAKPDYAGAFNKALSPTGALSKDQTNSLNTVPTSVPHKLMKNSPNGFGKSPSPSSSSPLSSKNSSPLPAHKCNTPDLDMSAQFKTGIASSSDSVPFDHPSSMSFKPAPFVKDNFSTTNDPVRHRRYPAPAAPPPLPPKIPLISPEQKSTQYSGSVSKPIPSPRSVSSHKTVRAPQYPPRQTRPLPPKSLSEVQFPHPVPRQSLSKNPSPDQSTDELDQSVLSAHELYPMSHQPSSSPYSSNVDITSPASKLPTQRSIIITYL